MPAREIIAGVMSLTADLEPRAARALDVSCRNGEVLMALAARGFEVRGSRFERGLPLIEGIPIDEGVDLTRALPYPDQSFDLVVLTEVIEHLENHRAAISELSRVLRPGGRLILTTPNIMRLDSRLGFALSGLHKVKRRQIPLDTPIEQAHRYHNYPITFALLYYLLHVNGLRLEALGHGKVKPFSNVLYAMLYPFVALDTRLRLIWRERKPAVRAMNHELVRWMLDRRVLTEDNLIVRAHKTTS
ncbi:MAG TPA: class I SAM-dependent methyltransferase [Candidatus Binataceae bacterium]|nr:class I SAM-dependent methyltransferase [Candidatus Binataceae bacterium]